MIVYAAIDLRGGRVVQLVGGRVENESVSLPDPLAVALRWIDDGYAALHIVDLDAALGDGDNRAIINEIIANAPVPVQVGGGVRDDAAVAAWLDAGASRVIIGTRAVEDAPWRMSIADSYPDRLVVAADVRENQVLTRGWKETTTITADEFLTQLNNDPLAGVLVTDVSREGQMTGIDVALFERLTITSDHALIAAGGIRDREDLVSLEQAGCAGAVLGMALYKGAFA